MTDQSDPPNHDATGSQGLANAGPWIRGWIKEHPLFLAVILVSLSIAFTALVYQAGKPQAENRYQVWVTDQVTWGPDRVDLSIAYPSQVRLQAGGEQRPVSVGLRWAEPTAYVTPAATPDASSPPTPTPGPWLVSLEPGDAGWLITDQDGVPVAPQVALTPGSQSAAVAVLFVGQAPVVMHSTPAPIGVSIYGPDGQRAIPVAGTQLSIGRETSSQASWRQFWGLLLGPTTPFLGMATALGAFALQLWLRESQQQQQERQDRARHAELEDVNAIELLLRSQPQRALDRLVTLSTSPSPLRYEPAQTRLDELRNQPETQELFFQAAHEAFGQGKLDMARRFWKQLTPAPGDRVPPLGVVLSHLADGQPSTWPSLDRDQVASVKTALIALQNRPGPGVGLHAAQLLSSLAQHFPDIVGDVPRAISLEYLNRLGLWPTAHCEENRDLLGLVHRLDLKFNPFGPEAAEDDPRLVEYRLAEPWEQARGRVPVCMFGPSGSGKTAASLLLGLDCVYPLPRPTEPGTLPVRYVLSVAEAADHSRRRHLERIVLASARTVAGYVAHWDRAFLSLSIWERSDLVHLLCLAARSREKLVALLTRHGPLGGPSDRLLSEISGLYHPAPLASETQEDLVELLGRARPAGLDCTYLLVDLPDSISSEAQEAIWPSVSALIDLIQPLAAVQVYAKLFLPDQVCTCLGAGAPYLKRVYDLKWSETQLARMLRTRLQAASEQSAIESLMQLGDPGVPGPPHDADHRLVKAAGGSPRNLVRLGNTLLAQAARRGTAEPRLVAEDLDAVLGPVPQAGGLAGLSK